MDGILTDVSLTEWSRMRNYDQTKPYAIRSLRQCNISAHNLSVICSTKPKQVTELTWVNYTARPSRRSRKILTKCRERVIYLSELSWHIWNSGTFWGDPSWPGL